MMSVSAVYNNPSVFCCRSGGVAMGAWDHDPTSGHHGQEDNRSKAGGECFDHCWSSWPHVPGNCCTGSGEVKEREGGRKGKAACQV